jgi:pyrimidine operon attenuation protein/uracil phosphoribosyltransferase
VNTTTLPSAQDLYLKLQVAVQLSMKENPKLCLLGISTGGAWLVEALQKDLGLANSRVGIISSSLHRDDFAQRGLTKQAQPTHIPFEVNDADLLLVDDVLYTGRTVRAVLNELFDYGRPRRVHLAVLVDRTQTGGRDLPICANFAAAVLSLPAEYALHLLKNTESPSGDAFTLNTVPL